MVLGTSQYKSGVRVTMFARSDRGIGYLAGEGDNAQIVRSVYKNATDAKKDRRRCPRRPTIASNGLSAGKADGR